MLPQLLVNLKIERKKFLMENFIGSDDIFALVAKGSFVYSSEYGTYTVRAGEGALFRRDVLYHREIIEPTTMYFFRFKSSESVFADHTVFCDKERIRSTLAMLDALDRGVFKDEFEYRRHLFFDLINQYAMENEDFQRTSKTGDPVIERALAYISEHLHKKMPLAEVGRVSGLSYVHFLRRFRAYTGLSPVEYVSALRLSKAKKLLADTNLKVKEIATLCGFENEYYFSNFFKKHSGMSPTLFRSSAI